MRCPMLAFCGLGWDNDFTVAFLPESSGAVDDGQEGEQPTFPPFVIEGTIQKEQDCIYASREGYCLRAVGGVEGTDESGSFYYLLGGYPDNNTIVYEEIYDRSEIDEAGYLLKRFRVTDTLSGVSFVVRDGEPAKLEIEIDNSRGPGHGGAVKRILRVIPVD